MAKAEGEKAGKTASRDARLVRSRNALVGALLGLLREKAFEDITVREITARAGTGYATFFRHYPAKEALLSDIASAQIAELFGMAIPALFSAGGADSTRMLCNWVAENRTLWFALLTGGAAATVRAEFVRQAREWAARAPAAKSDMPIDLSVVFGAGASIDILAWWLAHDDEMTAEQAARAISRLVVRPLVGDGPVSAAPAAG